ncbi:hypothetical protein RB195_013423 [Necator americanus]|uniref:Kunitz/Bovine pancreatic trypsin inhibitor domain protein n=1 Tax=Necator americanus TaxID=51031 RepID=A0ABR1DVE6_NECAM
MFSFFSQGHFVFPFVFRHLHPTKASVLAANQMTNTRVSPFILLFFAYFGVQSCFSAGKNPVLPKTGPCVLNDDGMKCTENGYYETVQCDARGCFCVSAHNGFAAYDTRTESNKIAPKCSNCHNVLKNLFAAGSPPVDTAIPKCDMSLGNYEPMQCDAKQVWCYCVDPVTGKELPNTRKRKEKNQRIRCDNTDFSLDPGQFPSTEGISGEQERYPVAQESCKLDRNRGTACRNATRSVRYFFDYKTFACLAFEYLGCGGNANNHRTSSECSSACLLPDLSGCSGMYPAARGPNGQAMTCGPPGMMMSQIGPADDSLANAHSFSPDYLACLWFVRFF